MKTRVYITVDTETSMGGAWASDQLRPLPATRRIFCRIGNADHGIGWICDELARYGMQATFFCETLSNLVLGDDDTRSYLDYLLHRGQDVQLHAHPNFHFYAQWLEARRRGLPFDRSAVSDNLGALALPAQRQILSEACAIFRRFTGRSPTAFRAGGYMASLDTLGLLRELGFTVDSSFNPAYQQLGSFAGQPLAPNCVKWLGGLWEVPVTVALQGLPEPWKPNRYRHLEVSALSLAEMRHCLLRLHEAGAQEAVIVMHSFSGVKPADLQYSAMRPDRIVMGRFRGLLAFLARHPERFTVSALGSYRGPASQEAAPAPAIPHLGYFRPFCRKVVQMLNRVYWL